MNPTQIRMARAALKWGVRELAEAAGTTANTVSRIETGHDAKASTLAAIQQAFETEGIQFITDDDGVGVILRPRRKRKARGSAA